MNPLALLASIAAITATTAMGVVLSILPASAQNSYVMAYKADGSHYAALNGNNDGSVPLIIHFHDGTKGQQSMH